MQRRASTHMTRAMDAAGTVERLRRAFEGREQGIAAACLFGGIARGESRADSGLDVAVRLEPAPERGTCESPRLDLGVALESEPGREIDLVVLDHAPPDLSHRALRNAILVTESDPSARVRFEVRARNESFDLKPYLDEYRHAPAVPR